MAQTDELFFEVPQQLQMQEALQSLDAISRNTERTASFAEQMHSELCDANMVMAKLQTESENHSTALLLILQNTERSASFAERVHSELRDENNAILLISQNTERTASFAERVHSELRDVNSVLERLRNDTENNSPPLMPTIQEEQAALAPLKSSMAKLGLAIESLNASIIDWLFGGSFVSSILLTWIAFICIITLSWTTPRDIRSFVLGIQDLPVNSTSALELRTVLFRNPNWKKLLTGATTPLAAST